MSYIIAFAIAAGIGPGRASSATGINPSADSADVKATPPVIVNFQGHLRQGMNIVNGTYSMTFRLYDAAAGGTLLQTMGPWNVNVANGVFNVELPITQANILNYTNLWIEVEIPGLGGIYSPRVKINSAAFAYNAFMSDSTQRIRNKGVTPEDLMMSAANPNQAANFDLNANGRIDAALLDVPASGTDPGYIWNQFAVNQGAPGSFRIATRGRAGADPPGRFGELAYGGGGGGTDVGGVYGQHSNTTAYGYLGVQNAGLGNVGVLGNGGNDGVFGQNNADYLSGAGVEGYSAFAASGIGGLFTGNASASSYVFSTGGGVYGTGTNYGVAGFSNTTATNGAGVRGTSLNAASGIGVVGAGNNLIPTVPSAGCGVAGTGDTVGTFGYATLAGGMGVWGVGANASSNGVYGQSPGTNSWAAVEGFASASNGIGAYFVGNNMTTGGIYFTDGGGVYGYDLWQGVVGLAYDPATGPNDAGGVGVMGFGPTQSLSGYYSPYNAGVSGFGEYIGVWGAEDNTGLFNRGILGFRSGAGCGVWGYAGSAQNDWAGYFDGPGTEGDVYVSGDIYLDGFLYKGGINDVGCIFVPGLIATVPTQGETPLYGMFASDVKVYFDGQGRLKNGEAFIPIPEDIKKVIAGNAQVVVTPVGSWSGIYVAEISSDGFLVKSGAGDPNAEFKWIAVAERKGAEGGKADDLVAQKLDKYSQRVIPPELTLMTTKTKANKSLGLGVVSHSFSELKTIKTTHKRTPVDAKELISEEEVK
ncbi:MAG: hypothetical protein ABIM19_02350 [candidate division WOR-3 bacterium]